MESSRRNNGSTSLAVKAACLVIFVWAACMASVAQAEPGRRGWGWGWGYGKVKDINYSYFENY